MPTKAEDMELGSLLRASLAHPHPCRATLIGERSRDPLSQKEKATHAGTHNSIGVYQAPEAPSFQAARPVPGRCAPGASLAGWLWGTSNDSGLSYCGRVSDTLPGSDLSVAADGHSDGHGDVYPLANGYPQSITDANPASSPDTNPDANASPNFAMRSASRCPARFFGRN